MVRLGNKLTYRSFTNKVKIGQGGFGTVFRARAIAQNKEYVLKVIKTKKLNKSQLKQVLNEGQIQKQANHENLISLWGQYSTKATHVFVLEFCPLGDLDHMMRAAEFWEGVDRNKKTKNLINQIVAGIEYLQGTIGFIHMDMKPSNVLVAGLDRLKVADFGTSVRMSSYRKIHYHKEYKGGTTCFEAPEFHQQKLHFDSTADVWAIGIIAYKLLTKKSPFFNNFGNTKNIHKNAICRMKKVVSGNFNACLSSCRLKPYPEAKSFLKQVFKARAERPLVRSLSDLSWLSSN